RDLELPAFIDDSWATISVSYSGNTEETLTVFAESLKRGCHSFAITSGGKLLSMDKALRVIKLNPGYQPRAAFPSIFSAVLQITESLLGIKRTDLERIRPILQSRYLDWEKSQYSPKDMARDLNNLIPVFIGARHLIPVAYRSKCQMNENAKALAFYSEIPESNHNEIESFDHRNDPTILPVLLRSQFEDDRIAARYEVISELYKDEGFSPIRFSMKSDSKIEEMLLMTFYLDLVTLELALLRGVDPTSVEKISKLKSELKNL
ncbi:MAG: SIS domain-containing protein, partial [Promethearchaeota archaeon]